MSSCDLASGFGTVGSRRAGRRPMGVGTLAGSGKWTSAAAAAWALMYRGPRLHFQVSRPAERVGGRRAAQRQLVILAHPPSATYN